MRTQECISIGIIGFTIISVIGIKEYGRVKAITQPAPIIQTIVQASVPHTSCHDSAVVVPSSTKVVCDEGAKQTIE